MLFQRIIRKPFPLVWPGFIFLAEYLALVQVSHRNRAMMRPRHLPTVFSVLLLSCVSAFGQTNHFDPSPFISGLFGTCPPEGQGSGDSDLNRLKKEMRQANIVDLRNIYQPQAVKGCGFQYISMGRN